MSRRPAHPFIGRSAEIARLLEIWESALSGEPALVLVGGDAGAGKTRLLEELRTRVAGSAGVAGAAPGAPGQALVLTGACVQVGAVGVPYLPVIDALRSVEASPAGLAVLVDEASHRPALARLLPHLLDRPVADGQSELDEPLAQGQLFEAVLRVLTVLSEAAPVLLILEDLHWSDASTRDLLAFLARTVRSQRIAVLASYRTDDLHRRHPLRPLLAELGRLPRVERLHLGPLSRVELAELLDGMSGAPVDPALAEQIFRRSEGNAFFAEELARTHPGGADALSEDLQDMLLARVEALPGAGRQAIRVAAVGGRRISDELLLAVSEHPETAGEGIRQALEAGLLVADGDRLAFRHALVQEAAYADVLPGERVRLHGRFADALSGPRFASAPAELAYHRLAGHDLPGALVALVAAAAEAEAVAAPAEAVRHLEQAIELLERLGTGADRLDLLTRAAMAAFASGDGARAAELGRVAVEEADRRGDVDSRAAARERRARYLMESDDDADEDLRIRDAQRDIGDAVALLAGRPATPLLARVLATSARSVVWTDGARAAEVLTEATRVADATGAHIVAADALVTRALLARRGLAQGDPARLLAEAVSRAGSAPDRRAQAGFRLRALRFHSAQLMDDGDLPGALAAADEGVALAAEIGQSWAAYGLDLRLMRGWVLIAMGRWEEAYTAALPALYAPNQVGRVLATQALAVLVGRGAPEAEALLGRLRAGNDAYFAIQVAIVEADLRLFQGRPAEALAVATHALGLLGVEGWSTETLLLIARSLAARAELAAAARAAGDRAGQAEQEEAAAAAVARMRAGSDQPGLAGVYRTLLRRRIEAEAARVSGADTPQDWAAVLAAAEKAGRVPDRAVAALAEARLRLAGGDRGERTIALLRSVLAAADGLGSARLRQAAELSVRRSRLEVAVGLSGAPPVGSATPLTPRESEVLALVAAGMSNRQIGRSLFITDKTASVHVSNILTKLGVASRTEAAAVARQRGLLTGES